LSSDRKWKRTHTCGQLSKTDKGETITLVGWVASQRDHGELIFIDLRDRWGTTQIVFHPEQDKKLTEKAKKLRMETVVGIKGEVVLRPKEMINKELDTGEIEVTVKDLIVFNESRPVPFPIKDPCDALDETRFKFRYLDLRRPQMQKNLLLRHRMAQEVRKYFDEEGFVEIETPFLMKSTPEGARDYLVPSRIHKGKFYALPQSPQTYKQLLMVSGFDRYFQIVRCFRDEDLRADRQPEFTQIDVEMSFVDEDDIIETVEKLMIRLFHKILGKEIKKPFPRISYDEAMKKYGTDRPDLRYDMEIIDITEVTAKADFKVFSDTVKDGGKVRGILLKKGGQLSRKKIDQWTAYVQDFGAKGLVTIQIGDEIVSPIKKFLKPDQLENIVRRFDAEKEDVIFVVAAKETVCCDALGNLRQLLAREYSLIQKNLFHPLWIVDFPLLEWSDEENRYLAKHHPFTSPKAEDLDKIESAPEQVRARAYDLVLNGSEIAGGSIRIHQRSVQERVFKSLGINPAIAKKKFGYLMDALEYGAPPHGGIAFGYDRLVMIFSGEESIREVIAFPKTTSALSLMDGSPSEIDSAQLKELSLKIDLGS
jgi:aspartyl-tRNA synthetase